jgi:hypothetical protein
VALDPRQNLNRSYVLSEEDRAKLKDLWSQYQGEAAPPNRDVSNFPENEEQPAPEFYAAKANTGIPGLVANVPGYSDDCTVYQLAGSDPTSPTLLPVAGAELGRRVYNLGGAVAAGAWVEVARDKYGKWWVVRGGGDSSFLALLVDKCYYYGQTGHGTGTILEGCLEDEECNGVGGAPKRFTKYTWIEVFDDGLDPGPPCRVRYLIKDASRCGSARPGCFPAYHARNFDYPCFQAFNVPGCCGTLSMNVGTGTGTVPGNTGTGASQLTVEVPRVASLSVVRLRPGSGDYYLFEESPFVDICRVTADEDGYGRVVYAPRYYDQNTGAWKDGDEGRLVEVG